MPLIPPALNGAVGVATNILRYLPGGPKLVTSAFVSLLANATEPRPRPLTMAGDYTSWISLTDRSFSGRSREAGTGESLLRETTPGSHFRGNDEFGCGRKAGIASTVVSARPAPDVVECVWT